MDYLDKADCIHVEIHGVNMFNNFINIRVQIYFENHRIIIIGEFESIYIQGLNLLSID